jgi:hypothetical protein
MQMGRYFNKKFIIYLFEVCNTPTLKFKNPTMNKTLRIVLFALFINVLTFSVTKAQRKADVETRPAVITPKYTGTPDDIEKRKAAEPKTYKTVQHQEEEVAMSADDIQKRAEAILNTNSVPADFPKYNPSTMDSRAFESKVAEYFRNNPDKRKRN